MLRSLLLVAALSVAPAAPVPVQHSGVLRSDSSYREVLPPDRYEGDANAVVIFAHRDTIASLCGAPDASGFGPIACTGVVKGTPVIVIPNPCISAESDLYAAVLCHELGHVNGWPGTHGD